LQGHSPACPTSRRHRTELWLLANGSPADLHVIAHHFSAADCEVLEPVLARVAPVRATLTGDELEEGTLHKDFILGNCVWQDGRPSVLDFAEARNGPLLYDLAPMLTNIGDEPHLRQGLLGGYRSVRALTATQEAALPMLEAIRHVGSCFSMIELAENGLHGPALDVHLPYRVGELRRLLPLL